MRITIVGCGAIGSTLAKAADQMEEVKRIYLFDINKDFAERVASGLNKAIVVNSVEDELYHSDLVVEAASQEAARDLLTKVAGRGVDIMLLSVGVLVDDDFRKTIFDKAAATECRIYIPTGALCGSDALRAASMDELSSVELITTNGPSSLVKIKYLEEQGIDVFAIKEKKLMYSGPAREAVKLFPRNVNLAATVSLLGVGFDRTTVKIILDPQATTNSHQLIIKGAFGTANSQTWNVKSPENPKTSYLASLSTIATLKRIIRNEWIGI
jgi:aspartate dehydrogenase